MTETPTELPLHPRHGIHEPTASTPARAPASLRRTSSFDMLRPQGLDGELVLVGRGRDLLTEASGEAVVLAEAELEARIAASMKRELLEIRTAPGLDDLERLIGTPASTGFRAVVDEVVPQERIERSLLYLLLDDLPVATLVGGYAIGAGRREHGPVRGKLKLQHPDLCAGWRAGGTMLMEIEQTGRVPVVTGPAAPSLSREGDPLAWHALDPLPAHGMRRHRRLDLVRDGDVFEADVLFRDSHMSDRGRETVVHEYTLFARIDAASMHLIEVRAAPRALPWVECELAAPSARDLDGLPLDGLRPHVRAELTGRGTCTHLNDTLRSLEDVLGLADQVPDQPL